MSAAGSDGPGAIRGGLLHFDCPAGVAGDMTVGALVDLGVPESVVRDALAALPLDGYAIGFSQVLRGALMGTKFRVEIAPLAAPSHARHDHEIHVAGHPNEHRHQHDHDDHDHDDAAHHHVHHGAHPHRHYAEIRALIAGSSLSQPVRERALAIFDRIARVEARLHGVAIEEVAFHEVGAIDSIVDIVATAAALDWLAPTRVTSRVVALGHGGVMTAHGLLPIPTPATLELLLGARVEDGGCPFELTTPTGAAILAATVAEYGALPAMEVTGAGWGAGDRELADRPNLLRVIAGRATAARHEAVDRCLVIEANVDDMTPELVAPLIADLLAAGARDAWVTPLLMKKGRPAWMVSALCDHGARPAVERALFRGSSSIGVRRHQVERTVLPRRLVEVQTSLGAVRVKVSGEPGSDDENVAPEWDDCDRLAREHGVPRKRVYAEALAAWWQRR